MENYPYKKGSIIKSPVRVGEHTNINGPVHFQGKSKIQIGRYCAIGANLRIVTTNHNIHYPNIQEALQIEVTGKSLMVSKGDVIIGNSVWIGDNVTITSGVKIGDGAVLATGACITKDVGDFEVFGGVPAKLLKKRFTEPIIHKLLELKWWNWDKMKIKENKEFFSKELTEKSFLKIR